MNKYLLKCSSSTQTEDIIRWLHKYPNDSFMIQIPNTTYINSDVLRQLSSYSNRISFQILGGYDDERIKNYPERVNQITNDNIYSFSETKKILEEIRSIEEGINPNWDEMQKLVYFIGKLGDKIIYHPFFEYQPSKEIRSLRGLLTGKTVCAGYSFILKELCDRNHIVCDYVEGCTNEADYKKDYLTHAWNIVTINGKNIPVDLTWQAGQNRKGNVMAIQNIGNVNEFVRSHFPGKYERVQNYRQTLSNVNGQYLRTLYNLINKNSINQNKVFYGKRDDQSRYMLVQDDVLLADNQYFIRYIYYDIYKDNQLSKPVILYSRTNVSSVVLACESVKKWKKQLTDAKMRHDLDEVDRLSKLIEKSRNYEIANDIIDQKLFSIENIRAAIRRGDYFVGNISTTKDSSGNKVPSGVEINLNHAKKIPLRQRTYTRNDGTSFVLEEVQRHKFGNYPINRYYLYERVEDSLQKNMIFSEEDLLADTRSCIPNDFLARDRLDRKQKESNGYLGYMSKDNVRTINRSINDFFLKDIYVKNQLNESKTSPYFPNITFDEMRNLVKVYEMRNDGTIVNRHTKQVLKDPDLMLRAGFALDWLYSAGSKYYFDEPIPGYQYAFNDSSEEVFILVFRMITESVNKYGNINPSEILDRVRQTYNYKYGEDIVTRLFGSDYYTNLINKLFRKQNPSAVREQPIESFHTLGFTTDAYRQLAEYKRKKEQEMKDMLEVVEDQGGLKVIPKR